MSPNNASVVGWPKPCAWPRDYGNGSTAGLGRRHRIWSPIFGFSAAPERSLAAISAAMSWMQRCGPAVRFGRIATRLPWRRFLARRRVSAFQARALTRLSQPRSGPRGTVISAGTGSGKTLAFYLPALTHLVADTPRRRSAADHRDLSAHRIAAGPTAQPVDYTPRAGGIGSRTLVCFTATCQPTALTLKDRRTRRGRPNPMVWYVRSSTCIEEGCGGRLVWPTAAGTTERLVCDRCSSIIGPEALTFTRDRLKASPPTILFTTTEMVNRELGSKDFRRVLIGDDSRSPEFVLLDEIHTYAGTHGAQVANLLRRWRAEIATPPHIVGLSATLADPTGFFADLTGLSTSRIAAVQPEFSEMDEVGREYFLALRGDPASQTSLLSTTIQASMLLRRVLDPNT